MNFILDHILTLILFIPTLAAVVVLLLPRENLKAIRWTAFIASLVPLGLSILLWFNFNPGQAGFQFQDQFDWYPPLHSSFHLGIDGISLTLVVLTTLLFMVSILASFNLTERLKAYMVLFLLLETGILGVFMTLDLMMFFVFWEVGLIPMYFLINQWGGPDRSHASMKFMIYTMAGSLGLLLAIQLIGVVSGTFDLPLLFQRWTHLQGTLLGLPVTIVKDIAFWAFALAFAIKVAVWPFHTWLPDAYTEAPTPVTMVLAGTMSKLGAYGFLRLVLQLYPVEAKQYAWVLALLAVMAIVFGALGAFGQRDFKRLIAYSSISHLGFFVLGIAAAAWAIGSQNAVIALNGSVLLMFNHGLTSAGLFFLAGVLADRTQTRDLKAFGGLFALVPVYGGVLIFTAMAALGLPGLNGFISEFLVIRGAWPIFSVGTAIAMIGLFFTGAYIVKALKMVLHGPLNTHWNGLVTEINAREVIIMAPLMALMLVIGVWPSWILDVINRAVTHLFLG